MGLYIFLRWTLFAVCIGEGDGILRHVSGTSSRFQVKKREGLCLSYFELLTWCLEL